MIKRKLSEFEIALTETIEALQKKLEDYQYRNGYAESDLINLAREVIQAAELGKPAVMSVMRDMGVKKLCDITTHNQRKHATRELKNLLSSFRVKAAYDDLKSKTELLGRTGDDIFTSARAYAIEQYRAGENGIPFTEAGYTVEYTPKTPVEEDELDW